MRARLHDTATAPTASNGAVGQWVLNPLKIGAVDGADAVDGTGVGAVDV